MVPTEYAVPVVLLGAGLLVRRQISIHAIAKMYYFSATKSDQLAGMDGFNPGLL